MLKVKFLSSETDCSHGVRKMSPKRTQKVSPQPEGGKVRAETGTSQTVPPSGGKLQRVNKLSEVVATKNSYIVRTLDSPRWIVTVMHFSDGNIKVRVSARTGQGLIQLLNLNAIRLDNMIELLTMLKQKLNELGVRTKEEDQEEEEW